MLQAFENTRAIVKLLLQRLPILRQPVAQMRVIFLPPRNIEALVKRDEHGELVHGELLRFFDEIRHQQLRFREDAVEIAHELGVLNNKAHIAVNHLNDILADILGK